MAGGVLTTRKEEEEKEKEKEKGEKRWTAFEAGRANTSKNPN